ncbi:MAG: cysteine methyltransferase [Desulfuromonas sp.]|nr:MAG: cysteine methyltransferase [Desulfuromonas sp.]
MNHQAVVETPVGTLQVISDDTALVQVGWIDESGGAATSGETDTPLLRQAVTELQEYFAGKRTLFTVPIRFTGSDFTVKVLKALAEVPYGEVVSYKELATRTGSPAAARGIGRVMAGNRLPIILPCHRVVAADGSLTGYSGQGGTKTKRWLLDFEKGNV